MSDPTHENETEMANALGLDLVHLKEQAEGYRKALEQIRDQDNLGDFEVAFGRVQYIARESLSDAATTQPKTSSWRVGGKVPLNVYENDRPMFQCHTPEHAARIVTLLNFAEDPFGEREPVPEAGEAPYLTIGEAAMIGKNAAEHALARACRERDLAQETIRQRDEVIEESWKQAREWGNEFGISADHLPALICGIGDKFFELQEQRDERIKSLADALKPFHEAYVLYENALTLAEEHLQSVSSIQFAHASDIYESTAPPAPCPTCKGTKIELIHDDEGRGEIVPCPTCTEPK